MYLKRQGMVKSNGEEPIKKVGRKKEWKLREEILWEFFGQIDHSKLA